MAETHPNILPTQPIPYCLLSELSRRLSKQFDILLFPTFACCLEPPRGTFLLQPLLPRGAVYLSCECCGLSAAETDKSIQNVLKVSEGYLRKFYSLMSPELPLSTVSVATSDSLGNIAVSVGSKKVSSSPEGS